MPLFFFIPTGYAAKQGICDFTKLLVCLKQNKIPPPPKFLLKNIHFPTNSFNLTCTIFPKKKKKIKFTANFTSFYSRQCNVLNYKLFILIVAFLKSTVTFELYLY